LISVFLKNFNSGNDFLKEGYIHQKSAALGNNTGKKKRLVIEDARVGIEQPIYEIGRTAAELLIKKILDPIRSNREVVLKTNLIIRQSCGCR